MKENKKYYTPDKEEFHPGFEYEKRDYENGYATINWTQEVYKLDSFLCIYDDGDYEMELDSDIKNQDIRVKYLDQSDIESCGFKLVDLANGPYSSFRGDTLVFNKLHSGKNDITIQLIFTKEKILHIFFKESKTTIFMGKCKNKSVFKQVIKMIGV